MSGPDEPATATEPSGRHEPAPGQDGGPTARPERPAEQPPEPLIRRLFRVRRVDLLVAVLLALLGLAAVAQVRATQEDRPLEGARQEDLVQILDELRNRNERLRSEIDDLADTADRLSSGTDTTEAALEEAARRAQVLGILAGTVPAEGPGVVLVLRDPDRVLGADVLLDALQELRDAGAEAVQLEGAQVAGSGTASVRVVASTALLDADDGVLVDGVQMRPPYRFLAVGDPATMSSALGIPGGVVDTVEQRGGIVQVEERDAVLVDALRPLSTPQYARPLDDG